MAEAVGHFEDTIAESDTRIEIGPLPAIHGIRVQLLRLFHNLLSNALKFRTDRPPHIRISCRQEGDRCLVAVSDNGIGIQPEGADRIFHLFQRQHSRGRYPGTGIGLAACRKIAERHGGQITVDSRPGEGAIFTVTLPLVAEEGSDAADR